MAKYFKTPFAKNGDRSIVPDSTQVDGSVSFEQGYGIDYERDQETDPEAKDIGRESFNGLFHDMTEAVGEIQSSGVAQWISGVSYPKGALVWRNKVLHLSVVDANTSAPPSDKWTILYDKTNTTVDKNNFIRAEGSKTTVVTDDITHDVNEDSREKVASAELVSKKWEIQQTKGTGDIARMSEISSLNIDYALVDFGVVSTNQRYVKENPFGTHTPVITLTEVFANDRWAFTGFYSSSSKDAFSSGGYVQSEGLVVQTGQFGVVYVSNVTGSLHNLNTMISSAMCRMHVWRLKK